MDVYRTAVQATPAGSADEYAQILTGLCVVLNTRFVQTWVLADVDEAVEMLRAAVQAAPTGHPVRSAYLASLGNALHTRFGRTVSLSDAEEAVEMLRAAVQATPTNHINHAVYLGYLGFALQSRFARTGELVDLDEAVDMFRSALQATGVSSTIHALHLASLGNALQVRFEQTGALADMDEAVEVFRAVTQTASPGEHNDDAMYLARLGSALHARFERTGVPTDADEAVEALRAAVQTTPNRHPDRPARLADLGAALQVRYRWSREREDSVQAIDMYRAAVQSTPTDHIDHAAYLSNLGYVLRMRFEQTTNPADLDEAVELGRSAIQASPTDYPNHAGRLVNLGHALHLRFRLTGAMADRDEALSVWGQAVDAETAPPSSRIGAARAAADLAADSNPSWAAAFLERAVLMLPEVTPRRLHRGDQQHALSSYVDLAADAVGLALAEATDDSEGRAGRALRLAEAGRGVLLSQTLGTRSDLSDLDHQHPGLAERFCELRDLLDQDRVMEKPSATSETAGPRPAGQAHQRHRLAGELEALLRRIRSHEEFADFGLPPTLEDLKAEAVHGPVATLNVSRYRSDAILLTPGGVASCPLPQLTREAVVNRVVAFDQALAEAAAPDREVRVAAQQHIHNVLEWLWEAAAEPVLTALGETIRPAQDNGGLPRVWWIPGGLLSLLPLHAAGFHTDPDTGPDRPTVIDRVVSSYTPTIRALRYARQLRSQPAEEIRSLIVAMPTTPGQKPLQHVAEEALRVRALLPRPVHLTTPAPGPALTASDGIPTRSTVLAGLAECAIAHFACHGASNHVDPSQSQLFLHDHDTTPLTVSALTRINLDHAQLAYLSACSTANPSKEELLDEAIHLASAFQLAGFPHVIGTLWPISDSRAVKAAESFYQHLSTGPNGTLDPSQAAVALHHTVRTLRDRYPKAPSLWASYLYIGA